MAVELTQVDNETETFQSNTSPNASPYKASTATDQMDEYIMSRIETNRQLSAFDEMRENKWFKFFTNFLFYIRVLILILTIFLTLLSLSYCIAQSLEPKLDLITECPEPKTREEIWQHSYESTFKYPPNQTINEESQVYRNYVVYISI